MLGNTCDIQNRNTTQIPISINNDIPSVYHSRKESIILDRTKRNKNDHKNKEKYDLKKATTFFSFLKLLLPNRKGDKMSL